MITRKDVRHVYGKRREGYGVLLESTIHLHLETRVDPDLIRREEVRDHCQRHAEHILRDGMYGEIRQELLRIRGCLRNLPLHDLDRAIASLIDKLEWRD